MIYTIDLSPETEARLTKEAQRRGLSPEAFALLLVEEYIAANAKDTGKGSEPAPV